MFHDPVHCLTSMHIQSAQLDFVGNNNDADADSDNKDTIRNLSRGREVGSPWGSRKEIAGAR